MHYLAEAAFWIISANAAAFAAFCCHRRLLADEIFQALMIVFVTSACAMRITADGEWTRLTFLIVAFGMLAPMAWIQATGMVERCLRRADRGSV